MDSQVIKQLTTKYTRKEIRTAVKLLSDVLNMPEKTTKTIKKSPEPFKSIDPTTEFSVKEITRLKRQEKDRTSGKAKYISAKAVWDELGI